MPVDLNDPKMEGYTPLQDYIDQDDDTSSRRIRDIAYGKKQEEIQFSATALAFSNTGQDYESPAQALVLTNAGYDDVTIFGHELSGDFVLKSALPALLKAGETATVQIAFKPTAVGLRTGFLYINTGDAAGDEYVALTGTGIVPGAPDEPLVVSGSRAGNAALASLLTQLATLGLITDNTTA